MKSLIALLLVGIGFLGYSQDTPPPNWYNLDLIKDSIPGASVEQAYELLKGRKSETVIVAVIDSGIDIDHEDLKGKIWVNEDEIAGNGIDDDKNGYVDDVYGWNFIGGKDSTMVEFDSYEITRQYGRLKAKYEYERVAPDGAEEEFKQWQYLDKEYKKRSSEAMREYVFYRDVRNSTADYMKIIKEHLKVDSLTSESVDTIQATNPVVVRAKTALVNIARLLGGPTDFESLLDELNQATHHFEVQVKYGYNIDYNPREVIGDDWENGTEVGYGNNIVYGPHSEHGTHVAGIIAASRNNGIGTNGVASNVLIMPIRAVPNGDERDKDVAAAIRYAVDNGAKVVNMSFGKYFENRRGLVDDAIKYAESKDVLLVCSAGNSNKDIDKHTSYPNPVNSEGVKAKNWIFVGAIKWTPNEDFIASFSNYGKIVDLFSPGVSIHSTLPENKYADLDGTSMAAPVVSGVAAMLRSYFPSLSAVQIRQAIINSVQTFDDLQVKTPGKEKLTTMDEISATGGIVNASAAVKYILESRELKIDLRR